LVLSNSGETAELRDVVAYARLSRVPLLAIVGRPGSSLAEAADVALVLPTIAEACPLGMAPTTSTTMMLVLGDALAVALMERRGFSAESFQVLHPGGRLGRRFIKVEDIMHTGAELPLAAPFTPMSEAILTMTEKRFGCLGVVDADGRLTGIITDGDLRRHMDSGLLGARADQVMTGGPKTIRAGALAAEALGLMNAHNITCLFVTDDNRPKGIIHVHDILRAGIA
jgi:arabinose-5-phosphate isomerase